MIMKHLVTILIVSGFFATPSLTFQESTRHISPDIELAIMKTLDEYMSAWNSKDLAAWERTFHFPHYRLASGKMSVLERAGLQDAAKVWARAGSDWHHSKWDRRRIIHASSEKVHVDTQFTRYREDGSKIGTYESLYIITKEEGRWGVKMRSSFAQ
jgi:hypothetical protein